MDEEKYRRQKLTNTKTIRNQHRQHRGTEEERVDGNEVDTSEADSEAWNEFSKNFNQVQSVLDRNRVLIQQVNENHQSRIPDNLVKNVSLIQEINGNISKVVNMYSDLSTNFTGVVSERQSSSSKKNGKKIGDNGAARD